MQPTPMRKTAALRVTFGLPLLLLGVSGLSLTALAQSQGTFTATGSMTGPRYFHTATLLPNGRILITGGITNGGVFAELYDPVTGIFTATATPHLVQLTVTAVLLTNGKVLVN